MRALIVLAMAAGLAACNCQMYPKKETAVANSDAAPKQEAPAVSDKPVEATPSAATEVADPAALKSKIAAKLPFSIDKVTDSPLPGVYAVIAGTQVFYTDVEGTYVLDGAMYDMSKGPKNAVNLTEELVNREQGPKRVAALDAIGEDKMVVFKAPNEKHFVTVFTDIDCGYCRKFHREVASLNQQGVSVRYMGFPRAGIGSPSYKKLASVWCADDPKEAMNAAKASGDVKDIAVCEGHPIDEHYSVVREFGLRGTPAIVLENGRIMPGYVPANRLVSELNK
tara:strand:+ start:558 stop:1400 length:843 start_codon:yes stop_codon:yes gene_type:complete